MPPAKKEAKKDIPMFLSGFQKASIPRNTEYISIEIANKRMMIDTLYDRQFSYLRLYILIYTL